VVVVGCRRSRNSRWWWSLNWGLWCIGLYCSTIPEAFGFATPPVLMSKYSLPGPLSSKVLSPPLLLSSGHVEWTCPPSPQYVHAPRAMRAARRAVELRLLFSQIARVDSLMVAGGVG
jgi:hypothetical protein